MLKPDSTCCREVSPLNIFRHLEGRGAVSLVVFSHHKAEESEIDAPTTCKTLFHLPLFSLNTKPVKAEIKASH